MPLHDDLLTLAGRLLGPPPHAATPEADLRRAVSTAYYALFHRLIDAATAGGVPNALMRPFAARSLEHRGMLTVCRRYSAATTDIAGQPIPQPLRRVATNFVTLQIARHRADYNVGTVVRWAEAEEAIRMAIAAFADWAAVAADPAADGFLTELLLGGLKDR